MTVRHWNVLVRKLGLAQARQDRAACIIIAAALRKVVADGAPTGWEPDGRAESAVAARLPGWS